MVKVTFTDAFPSDVIQAMLETDFLGLGTTYSREGRVLYVQPFVERYAVLKEQLEVWKREGGLSFTEEFA